MVAALAVLSPLVSAPAAEDPGARAEPVLQGKLPDGPLTAGIALHYGEVSYGNIGSGRRLDLTVIGPDVNLLSHIQSVCSTGHHPPLISARFAGLLSSHSTVALERRTLRGFAEPIELHTLVPSEAEPNRIPITP